MRLTFKTEPDLSVLHAAAVVGLGIPAIDEKLTSAMQGPVGRINDRIELSELDSTSFWLSLVKCSLADDAKRVEHSLLRAGCSELTVDSIAPAVIGQLTDARLAFRNRYPKLAEQLPLRSGPLRELWDAAGPGLLREVGRRTISSIIPTKATLLLLQPVRGGDGGLVDRNDMVWIEAVLTHPEPSIPETLRLVWLLARKGVDRIESNRWVQPERLPQVVALALIPFVLGAGEELGLCRADESEIRRAVELWHAADICQSENSTESLVRWWAQMREGELPLPVALKALDKMLLDHSEGNVNS